MPSISTSYLEASHSLQKEQVVNFDQSLGPFFVDTIKSGLIRILGKLTGLRPTPLVALGIN